MRLTVLPEYVEMPATQDNRSIEEKMAEIVAKVPSEEWEKLPADLGDNLDHIYSICCEGLSCR